MRPHSSLAYGNSVPCQPTRQLHVLRVIDGDVRICLDIQTLKKDCPRAAGNASVAVFARMKEEQPVFKVTDRRLFNADGTPRELSPEERVEPTSHEAAPTIGQSAAATGSSTQAERRPMSPGEAPGAAAAANEAYDEAEMPEIDDPASFINFAMSIASNAASYLGMMEHPVTHKREVDLQLATHWIDVLGMLEQKTRGNLSAQEAQMLEGLLADLRMQYVSLTQTSAPKTSRAYTGRDITGGR